MPRTPRIYTEMIRLRITPEQKAWLDHTAGEHTNRLNKEVKPSVVVRALLNREMDLERELGKAWDA